MALYPGAQTPPHQCRGRSGGTWKLAFRAPCSSEAKRLLVYTVNLIRGLVDVESFIHPNYDNIVLENFGLFHDSFPGAVVKKKHSKTAWNTIMVLNHHWPGAKVPTRPLVTLNSWEALTLCIKKGRGGKRREETYLNPKLQNKRKFL